MDYRPERKDRAALWTGLFLLLVGGTIILHEIGIAIPDQLFNWHLLLTGIGLFLGLKHNFRGVGWLIITTIGGVWLVQDYYPDMALRRFALPGILLLIGFILLTHHRGRGRPY